MRKAPPTPPAGRHAPEKSPIKLTPPEPPAPAPEAAAKADHNTVSFRTDPEIIERLDSLRPHARRTDGHIACKSDVSRAIFAAVLGDPAIVGRIMAAPGATIFDKLRGVLKKLA